MLVDGSVTDDELQAALSSGAGRDFVALDSCYSGGCGRPFHENGCGGMSPSNLVF